MSNHSEPMLSLIAFLSERPTPDQVAQFLVLQSLRDFHPRAAVMCIFISDGSVLAVGSFGLPQEAILGVHHRSLWDNAPAINAIREGNPVIRNGPDGHKKGHATSKNFMDNEFPNIAWPLIAGSQRVGSLQIHFTDYFDSDGLSQSLEDISGLIALYLVFQNSNHGSSYLEHENSHQIGSGSLTSRQMQILKLLARGMTNPQISVRIGYSESTVRQETMAIYRHLGVNGRRAAVDVAAIRGILEPEDQVAIQS